MACSIYFVTSNVRKFEEYTAFFHHHKIKLVQFDAELIEPQSVDGLVITQHKLEQACRMLPNKKILVDDRGFNISALNNFPGPMLKLVLNTIGTPGLVKLLVGNKDRRAEFTTSLGYFDGRDEHFFQTKEKGFMLTSMRGTNLRGWTDLLYAYGHTTLPGKSLAELTDEEWEEYLRFLEHDNILEQITKLAF